VRTAANPKFLEVGEGLTNYWMAKCSYLGPNLRTGLMRQGREWGGTGTAVAATRVGGGGGIGRRCVGGDGKLWHGGGTSRAEILRTGSGWGWSGPTQGQEEEEEEMKVSVRCGRAGREGGEETVEAS
jgi:hypothetical protein